MWCPMKKRGRPSEQLRRETAEGRVWSVVSALRSNGEFASSIRDIARLSGYSTGAIAKTFAWRGYLTEKKNARARAGTSRQTRRRNSAESVEGRVMQIVLQAGSDYSLTIRQLATFIGCSATAIGKTQAWKGYVRAREAEKEATRLNRPHSRIK